MKSKVEETLGRNLRRLRDLKGVSQGEMAKIAGVSQKTVSNLENRETEVSPKLKTIIAVADYFKVHPGLLLTADLTDDSLTNQEVSLMLERFAQLQPEHKRRIMDLIGDYWQLQSKNVN